jgi:hypothetical protein
VGGLVPKVDSPVGGPVHMIDSPVGGLVPKVDSPVGGLVPKVDSPAMKPSLVPKEGSPAGVPTECPICFEEPGVSNMCITNCGHILCIVCAKELICKNNQCPICSHTLGTYVHVCLHIYVYIKRRHLSIYRYKYE